MPVYKVDGVKKDGLQKYNVRVNYISNEGIAKQLTRTAYGLEAAKDLERRLTDEQKSKGEAPTQKMTVQQLFDKYITVKQHEVKDSSLEKCKWNLEYYILPTFKDIRIDRLTVEKLQDWKLSMETRKSSKTQGGLSLNTKKHAFSEFRAMLNYAVKMEYLAKNPLVKLGNFRDRDSIKPEMAFYTAQDFKQFISTAKKIAKEMEARHKDLSEWNYFVFFNIAFYTGLRKGEIYALKWSDINGSYLSVKRSISQKVGGGDRETPPKNKSSIRTLQMPLPLIKVLDEHRKRQAHLKNFSDGYRICGGERCLRDSSIERRNTQYSTLAGVKKIRVHGYRHSHVSLLAQAGINIQEVARRLGHSRIEITWNTYSHLYPGEEERAVDILNGIA